MATGEVAMAYTRAAMERAMKVADVLLQALKERQPWIHVGEVLGVSARTVRRLRWRYEHYGFDGLFDHRRQRPSPRCAPLAEVQHLLRLYRARYAGFNIRHFHQIAQREHGVTLSYSFVKQALQAAGLVAKRRPRGRHRRRREPRPCFGELVHLDGSLHAWLALVPAMKQTLIAVVDDATKQLPSAELIDGGESTAAIMTALRAVLERYGLPAALYTDRAHWAVHTPTSGTAPDRFRLTQFGRALARLGIEHIQSYSPQARGHSERVNGTLQDRLVNELRVAGVRTLAAANRYLCERFIPDYNARFGRPPTDPTPPARSCRSAATTSTRSSVTRRSASSPVTTPSRSAACSSSSTSSAAGAPARACACWSGVISTAPTRFGGGRAAWGATMRVADSVPREPRRSVKADRSRVKRERPDHLSTTGRPRQRGRPRHPRTMALERDDDRSYHPGHVASIGRPFS